MPRVVGIDHLVLSVGNFARSKEFYGKVLGFLGFKLKHDVRRHGRLEQRQDAVLDRRGRHPGQDATNTARATSAFTTTPSSLSSRKDVDDARRLPREHGMTVVDPPGEYYDRRYYAVYFTDPDGMKLEGMVYKPPPKQRRAGKKTKRA